LESQSRWPEADELSRVLLALRDRDANPVIRVTAAHRSIPGRYASGGDEPSPISGSCAKIIAREAQDIPARAPASPSVVAPAWRRRRLRSSLWCARQVRSSCARPGFAVAWCLLVFAGQPLSTIAHSLNVSRNTVRSHLKQIFHKTDTHGQMDLVPPCTHLPDAVIGPGRLERNGHGVRADSQTIESNVNIRSCFISRIFTFIHQVFKVGE
jgi:hypothetical protein